MRIIDADALKKTIKEKCGVYFDGTCDNRRICAFIDNAPTVMPERPQVEWTPVSERLPENRDWYLGLFKEPDTDFIGIPYICDYVGEVTKGTTKEGWILRHCTDVDTVPDYFRNLICVAWQPLPEPYEKGGAE